MTVSECDRRLQWTWFTAHHRSGAMYDVACCKYIECRELFSLNTYHGVYSDLMCIVSFLVQAINKTHVSDHTS